MPHPRTIGELTLQFKQSNGHTTMHTISQKPPLRVIRAFQQADGAAAVHLHNISGGVLGGDDLSFTAHVAEGARVQLTTPSSTRVYRHRAGYPSAIQRNHFTVGVNGLLEYLPDTLIPFAQALYRQETTVHLHEGAGLFWWEILTPGREAREERFAYQQLDLTVEITTPTRPIAIERVRLTPATQSMTSVVRFGPYRYSCTFYICKVGLPDTTWSALETELATCAKTISQPSETIWGISTLPLDGLVLRGLSQTGRALEQGLVQFWRLAKQALYQTEPILPRKLY